RAGLEPLGLPGGQLELPGVEFDSLIAARVRVPHVRTPLETAPICDASSPVGRGDRCHVEFTKGKVDRTLGGIVWCLFSRVHHLLIRSAQANGVPVRGLRGMSDGAEASPGRAPPPQPRAEPPTAIALPRTPLRVHHAPDRYGRFKAVMDRSKAV